MVQHLRQNTEIIWQSAGKHFNITLTKLFRKRVLRLKLISYQVFFRVHTAFRVGTSKLHIGDKVSIQYH